MEPNAELKKQVEKQIKDADWAKILAIAKEKKEEFRSINISDEGAMHIAISELYPEFKFNAGVSQSQEFKCRVVNKTKLRFIKPKGSSVKDLPVRDIYVATEKMGVLKSALFGKEIIELFKRVEYGDPLLVRDAKIGAQGGEATFKVFTNSEVIKLEEKDVPAMRELLKPVQVSLVKESEVGIVEGLVVSTNTIKYERCPMCDGKLSLVEEMYHCATHGTVIPVHKEATEVIMDTSGGIARVMFYPETINDGRPPQQLDKLSIICLVRDTNHYKRDKARETGVSEEVVMNQFPRNMQVTVYSYEAKPAAGKPVAAAKKTDAPVNVEDIEDAA